MEIVRVLSAWFARLVHVKLLGKKDHLELQRFVFFIVDYQHVIL